MTGMGWFGWTEQQTFATDMESIVLALKGRKEMYRYIFGSGEEPAAPVEEAPVISQRSILSILRMHNEPER